MASMSRCALGSERDLRVGAREEVLEALAGHLEERVTVRGGERERRDGALVADPRPHPHVADPGWFGQAVYEELPSERPGDLAARLVPTGVEDDLHGVRIRGFVSEARLHWKGSALWHDETERYLNLYPDRTWASHLGTLPVAAPGRARVITVVPRLGEPQTSSQTRVMKDDLLPGAACKDLAERPRRRQTTTAVPL